MTISKLSRCILLILVTVLACATAASAQNPIRWRVTAKLTSETEGVLTVKALVGDGWHLYGTKLPAGGPKPTTLDFSASKGIKFVSSFTPSVQPIEKMDPVFDLKLNFWESNVTFSRKFKLTGPKSNAVVSGKITYMGCNDENCLPPKTDTFTIRLK